MADILAKMYNLMIFKYNYDNKKHKADKKYRKVLQDLRERHIEELIGLFGGKYKRVKSKEEKEEKGTAKKEESSFFSGILSTLKKGVDKALSIFKSPATKAAVQAAKPAALSTAVKIGATAGIAGLSTAIMAHESKGSPDAYNYYTDSKGKKPGNIKNIKSVIKDAGTGQGDDVLNGRKLSDMTVAEIQDLQSQGKLYAVGKWQIIPTTMDDMVQKLKIDPTKQKFDDDFQEKLFTDYFAASKRPLIGKYLSGDSGVSKEDATMEIAKEWSSVGVPRDIKKGELGIDKNGIPMPRQDLKKGDSFYKGGGDTSATSPDVIGTALEKAKVNQKPQSSSKAPVIVSPPPVNIPPDPKQLNKQSSPNSDSISMLNNTTNIAHGGTTYLTEEEKANRPALIEKTYYG